MTTERTLDLPLRGMSCAYPLLGTAGLLSPVYAGAAMALSSVSVVTNSLRLRRFRPAGAA